MVLMVRGLRVPASLALTLVAFGLAGAGCTSMGHEKRAIPRISRPIGVVTEFGLDSDDHDLGVTLEKLLDTHGIKASLLSTPQVRAQRGDKEYTYDEVQTRYVLRVRSMDLDTCVPEGSRQMHFNLSVTDFDTRRRLLLMDGEFGCRDTILREFEKWLLGGQRPQP